MTERQRLAVMELVASVHGIPSIYSVTDYRTFETVVESWIRIHELALKEIKGTPLVPKKDASS